jgi:hypothetical protein
MEENCMGRHEKPPHEAGGKNREHSKAFQISAVNVIVSKKV